MNGREELFLARAYRDFFAAAGYTHVYRFLVPSGARLLRRLPDRANLFLEVRDGNRTGSFFLKCHAPRRWGQPAGIAEWQRHALLAMHGIPVPDAAAAGQESGGASFFCSANVHGAVPLDQHLACAENRDRGRVRGLATLVRKLHAIPLCHRDLYLCHILARIQDGALFVIDLQRVKGRPGGRLRRRWFIKDLAALAHSSHLPGVTRTDRLRFLLAYLGRPRLDIEVRRWFHRVARKARRMARHTPRFDGQGGCRSVR